MPGKSAASVLHNRMEELPTNNTAPGGDGRAASSRANAAMASDQSADGVASAPRQGATKSAAASSVERTNRKGIGFMGWERRVFPPPLTVDWDGPA
jgi:hypothetical protein